MIDTEIGLFDFLERLRTELTGARLQRPRSFDWMGNWVQVWENDDYIAKRARPTVDEYLYFRYRMEVTPTENIHLDDQLDAALQVKRSVENTGAEAVICADFEDLLGS